MEIQIVLVARRVWFDTSLLSLWADNVEHVEYVERIGRQEWHLIVVDSIRMQANGKQRKAKDSV